MPKLHKDGIPMRPIVSCIQSPLNKLSKYLKDILTNIVHKSSSYIKDSWQFKEKIKNIILPNNYIIISLDVISLYTNVPIELALSIIRKKWNEIKKFTDIPLDEFLTAIELTLKSTYFLYNDKCYKQIEGCAMGSSISSVIAQMVLEELESEVISKLPFQLPYFYRYVDDCITAVPKTKTTDTLNAFNAFHPKLKFTIEIEENNKINFLDMTLHHTNNTIKTEWYTKKTWSGRYLNFYSQHHMSQKKSVVIGLADRAIKLSDSLFQKKSIEKAKNILLKNSYPSKLINSIFKSRLQKINNTANQQPKKNKNNYLTLPYIKDLSENIQTYFKQHDITISHKGYNLLQQNFSSLKNKTNKLKKTHVIYQIPCSNCQKVYIGQTSQHLQNRLNGHKYDKKNVTALGKHESQFSHKFNFKETKILKTEPNQQKREVLEMIYIKKNSNSINDKTDIKNLSKIYNNLIN